MSDSQVSFVEGLLKAAKAGRFPLLHSFFNFLLRLLTGKSPEFVEILPRAHAIQKGVPTDYFVRHAYFKSGKQKPDSQADPARDGCGLIWFAPIVPLASDDVTRILDLAKPLFKQYGFDFYAALMVMNPGSIIPLMSIYYRKEDREEAARAQALYDALAQATEKAGYSQYRTSVSYMEKILSGNAEFRNCLHAIKNALDPNRILAPGKYGVSERGSR